MRNRQTWIWVCLVLLLIPITYEAASMKKLDGSLSDRSLKAEQFLIDHLMKRDGRIQTDLTEEKNVYLSETVGLWMDYLLVKGDQERFDQQVDVLKKYFMTEEGLVTWRITGRKAAPANASIDDLRIMNALFEAGVKWSEDSYTNLAKAMEKALAEYQIRQGYMVDYVELASKQQGSFVTLSYIIPSAFNQLKESEAIGEETYINTVKLLTDLPTSPIGFFPKSFDVEKKRYSYDEKVNLIDQYYIGYHRTQWGGDVAALLDFTERELLKNDGKLYGVYELKTGKPVVSYEGAAVYALAILMCLELDEKELAQQLFTRMKTLQQNDESMDYYGGYVDLASLDTHTFDNLLALIAERVGMDEKVF